MTVDLPPLGARRLRDLVWPRFLTAPDAGLLEALYVPALGRAQRYDRCCAYFTSGVLAAAARGYGGLIENLLALGETAPRPAVRLLVNVQLDEADVKALQGQGRYDGLAKQLLKGLKSPQDALEQNRLAMLGWLVREGLLQVKVGYMRRTLGILHGKYGVIVDGAGDKLAFSGSGNETEAALRENYEELQVATSWQDAEYVATYAARFEALWNDEHEHVGALSLPEAVRLRLIACAPPVGKAPPKEVLIPRATAEAAMFWNFLAAAPYLANGAQTMDATAPVDLWPHQQHVVEDTAAAWPAGRLLCDEVGMGKTIEAILVLRRLLAGRGVARALLLAPAGLLRQWQTELREKGGLLVPFLDGDSLMLPGGGKKAMEARDALAQTPLLLVSREWARTSKNRELVLGAPKWDLVLLDEAHHARRGSRMESEFNQASLLLDLLRQLQLRGRTRSILLLSATPMQIDPWEPWDLLQVLGVGGEWLVDFGNIRSYYHTTEALKRDEADAGLVGRAGRLIAADPTFPPLPVALDDFDDVVYRSPAEQQKVADAMRAGSPLARRMHRNTRDTLRTYYKQGKLAYEPPRRRVEDVRVDFETDAERETYDHVARYIDERYAQLEKEKGGKGFVMTVYQRRASSSPLALRRSLGRRRDLCDKVIHAHAKYDFLALEVEGLDVRDLGDAALDETIDPAAPPTPQAAAEEKKEIDALLGRLNALGLQDTKLKRFVDVLQRVSADGRSVLVFTEYTDTMEYLRDELRPTYGETLATYSGQGGQVLEAGAWKTVSKAEITKRLAGGTIRVLVCTDAASEGLNLQAASALINYDLPWNPSKVEQRIGRIDRIGQQARELPIRNLFLKDSVDEAVYGALRSRCRLFEHYVGKMQPVLAIARDALKSNLRGVALQARLADINTMAAKAAQDTLADAAYAPSLPGPAVSASPPVTRSDLEFAFALLNLPAGKVKAKKQKQAESTWQLTLAKKSRTVGFARSALEANEQVKPFTLLDAGEVARLLAGGAGLPLVVGIAEAAPFRTCEVRWVTAENIQAVESAEQLRAYLKEWDGSLPAPARLVEAEKEARTAATARLQGIQACAATAENEALRRQVASARSRLLAALARHLRLTHTNLDVGFKALLHAEKDMDGLYHRAYRLLGGWPTFAPEQRKDADALVAGLSDKERGERSRLPAELKAALDDPRWLALGALGKV